MRIFLFCVQLSAVCLIYNRWYCFRPPWPNGIPRATAAVLRGILRNRGCGGKRPCLPCLERKRTAALHPHACVSFSFPAYSKQTTKQE